MVGLPAKREAGVEAQQVQPATSRQSRPGEQPERAAHVGMRAIAPPHRARDARHVRCGHAQLADEPPGGRVP